MRAKSEQEAFWEGKFGEGYLERNRIDPAVRTDFFSNVLSRTHGVQTICEFGCNLGTNLKALQLLSENYRLTGVELNKLALKELESEKKIATVCSSIQDFSSQEKFDLVFTCGVLIHIHPDDLPSVFEKMYSQSKRYIMMNEYFSHSPEEVSYHGHSGKLFKRDFGDAFMQQFGEKVRLVDYGFLWKRTNPSWDNVTWFLFEKVDE